MLCVNTAFPVSVIRGFLNAIIPWVRRKDYLETMTAAAPIWAVLVSFPLSLIATRIDAHGFLSERTQRSRLFNAPVLEFNSPISEDDGFHSIQFVTFDLKRQLYISESEIQPMPKRDTVQDSKTEGP